MIEPGRTLEEDQMGPKDSDEMPELPRTVTQEGVCLPVGGSDRSADRSDRPGEDEETSAADLRAEGALPGAHPISVQKAERLDCRQQGSSCNYRTSGVCDEARKMLLALPESEFLWSKKFKSLEEALDNSL